MRDIVVVGSLLSGWGGEDGVVDERRLFSPTYD